MEAHAEDTAVLPYPNVDIVPFWDEGRRELWLGDILLKRFRRPAKLMEFILGAFQEEGWPPGIDDPLPGGVGVDTHERLKSAVVRLNKQNIKLIRFLRDGTGQGIIWEFVKSEHPDGTRTAPG